MYDNSPLPTCIAGGEILPKSLFRSGSGKCYTGEVGVDLGPRPLYKSKKYKIIIFSKMPIGLTDSYYTFKAIKNKSSYPQPNISLYLKVGTSLDL